MNRRRIFASAALLVFVGTLASAAPVYAGLGVLAECITRSGAVLYGTGWCKQCTAQKSMFRGYENRLRYVQCSPRGNSDYVKPQCKKLEISSYPTWIFGDGTKRSGVQSLEALAQATGCRQ